MTYATDAISALRRMGAADRLADELRNAKALLEKLNREPQQLGRHPEILFQVRRIDSLLSEVSDAER